MRPAKIQISLRIHAGCSESSLGAIWIAKDSNFPHAVNEDSNQTARMRRLIRVFVGRICQKVPFLTLWINILPSGIAVYPFLLFLLQQQQLITAKAMAKKTITPTMHPTAIPTSLKSNTETEFKLTV